MFLEYCCVSTAAAAGYKFVANTTLKSSNAIILFVSTSWTQHLHLIENVGFFPMPPQKHIYLKMWNCSIAETVNTRHIFAFPTAGC